MGKLVSRFCGRAEGARVVQQVAVPSLCGSDGVIDDVVLGLLWVKRGVRDLMIIILGVGRGKPVTKHRLPQWNAIRWRLEHHSDAVRALLSIEGSSCAFRFDSAATLAFHSLHATGALKQWALLADAQAGQQTVKYPNEPAGGGVLMGGWAVAGWSWCAACLCQEGREAAGCASAAADWFRAHS